MPIGMLKWKVGWGVEGIRPVSGIHKEQQAAKESWALEQ